MGLQLFNCSVFFKQKNKHSVTYHNVNNLIKFENFARSKLHDVAYINVYYKNNIKGSGNQYATPPFQTIYILSVYICTAFFEDTTKSLKDYFVVDLIEFQNQAKQANAKGFNVYCKREKAFKGTVFFNN